MGSKVLIQTGNSMAIDASGRQYKKGGVLRPVDCEYHDGIIERGEASWETQLGGDDHDGWESICEDCVELISAEQCVGFHRTRQAEHASRHAELHKYLDELIADWIDSSGRPSLQYRVLDLMHWSAKQTDSPDHPYRRN